MHTSHASRPAGMYLALNDKTVDMFVLRPPRVFLSVHPIHTAGQSVCGKALTLTDCWQLLTSGHGIGTGSLKWLQKVLLLFPFCSHNLTQTPKELRELLGDHSRRFCPLTKHWRTPLRRLRLQWYFSCFSVSVSVKVLDHKFFSVTTKFQLCYFRFYCSYYGDFPVSFVLRCFYNIILYFVLLVYFVYFCYIFFLKATHKSLSWAWCVLSRVHVFIVVLCYICDSEQINDWLIDWLFDICT